MIHPGHGSEGLALNPLDTIVPLKNNSLRSDRPSPVLTIECQRSNRQVLWRSGQHMEVRWLETESLLSPFLVVEKRLGIDIDTLCQYNTVINILL